MVTKVDKSVSSTPGIVDNSNATAITITSDENVLIGSSTSIASNIGLQVTGTDNPAFISLFRDDSSVTTNDDLGGILWYGNDNSATTQFAYIRATAIGTHVDGDNPTALRFGTTANGSEAVTERMRINDSGTLQIGKTSSSASDAGHQFFQSGPYYLYSPATQAIRFYNTDIGSQAGHITISGSTISMADGPSDISTKENINDWNENVLESFKNIKPVTFNYKNDKTKEVKKGYIAQNEVDKFPEAYAKNSEDNLHWFYPSEMTVYLMKAIQEQQDIIDDLKSRIETLEG